MPEKLFNGKRKKRFGEVVAGAFDTINNFNTDKKTNVKNNIVPPAQIGKVQETPQEIPNNKPKKIDLPGEATIDNSSKKGAFVLPDGSIFVGDKKDIVGLIENKQLKEQRGQGTQPIGTAQNQVAASQQAAQIQQGLSGQPILSEQDLLNAVPQEPGLENLQAGAAGLAGGIAGGIGGAATIGALGGSALGPAGTIAGGAIGALVGAIGAAYGVITADKRADVKQAFAVAKVANTNFGQTIDALNAGLITKEVALRRFQNDRVSLYAARQNLLRETNNDLDRFLSGGADELAKVNDLVNDLELIYSVEFAQALTQPNPQNIKYVYQNGVVPQDE